MRNRKSVFALAICSALLLSSFTATHVAAGDTYVRGYVRRDGTYVAPHHQSTPDGNPYNNYGFPGNLNPFTGERAMGNPDTYLRNYGSGGMGGGINNLYGTPRGSLYGR